MRLSVRLAAALTASLSTATAGAQSYSTIPDANAYPVLRLAAFSQPTEQFFTGTVTRATYFGCTSFSLAACVTSVFEIGIERATGRGAARSLVTRLEGFVGPAQFSGSSPGRLEYRVGGPYEGGGLVAGAVELLGPPPGIPYVVGADFRLISSNGIDFVGRSQVGTGIQWETFALTPSTEMYDLYMYGTAVRAEPLNVCGRPYCDYLDVVRSRQIAFATVVLPEPSTYALLGTGLLTLGGIAVRRRRSA
jgi:hypothetical protein